MELKQLLTVILIITVSFTVLLVGALSIVVYKPEYVGFQKTGKMAVKVDTVKRITSKNLSVSKVSNSNQKQQTNQPTSQISPKEKQLYDSLNKIQSNYAGIRDSVAKMRDSLVKTLNYFSKMKDSLETLKRLYSKAAKDIEKQKLLAKNIEKINPQKLDSLRTFNLKQFAKIYDNSTPQAVAKILGKVKGQDAALVLKYMDKKKAGKVLESMKPEEAAAIMLHSSK